MWNTVTSDDVKTRLSKPELTALLTAARQLDQTDEGILADAIAAVTAEVRGYVAANSRNQLGPAGTIPDELQSAALALLRRYLFTRLPNMKALYDEIRQGETEDAMTRLRDTARGLFAIVPPESPASASEQVSGGSPRITPRERRYGSEDGV